MDTSPLSGLRFTNILAPSVTGLPIVLPAPFKEQKSLILILLDLPCFLLQITLWCQAQELSALPYTKNWKTMSNHKRNQKKETRQVINWMKIFEFIS